MQKIKVWSLAVGLWLLAVRPVMAITPTIAIQNLPQYTNSRDFNLSCSAIGGSNVQFAFRKESGSYQDFGSVINLNTSSCQIQVTGSQISEETKYYFKATLDGGVSSETFVIFDNSGPSSVSGFYKDELGDGFRLHYHTPSDSDFDKVIIYRGDTLGFSADSSHEIATINSSPNSDMTYEDHSGTGRVYNIRALDHAGNSSSLVGDSGTITTNTNTIVTNTTPQNGSSKVIKLPSEVGAGGQVLGEEKTSESEVVNVEPTQNKLEVLTEKAKSNEIQLRYKILYIGGGLLALVAILLAIFKRRKK
ncbi:MAG: hypothetical protein AAB872_01165 [Patescibacteria group bacterium]